MVFGGTFFYHSTEKRFGVSEFLVSKNFMHEGGITTLREEIVSEYRNFS